MLEYITLAVDYERLGDMQRAQGDLQAALASYQQSLQIAKQLAARDPASKEWQKDLLLSLSNMAIVLEQQSPPQKKEAAIHYQQILTILRPLAAENRPTANLEPRLRGSGRVRGFLFRRSSSLCRSDDMRYDGTSPKPCRRGASWRLPFIRSVRWPTCLCCWA